MFLGAAFFFIIASFEGLIGSAHAVPSRYFILDVDAWLASLENSPRSPVCADVDPRKVGSLATLPFEQLGAAVENEFKDQIVSRKPNFVFPLGFNHDSEMTTPALFRAEARNDHRDSRGIPDRIVLHGAGIAPGFGSHGYLATVCHEIGHVLGGGPYLKPNIVLEAQADDFAARACLKKVFANDPNTISAAQDAPAELKTICAAKYTDRLESAVCVRTLLAGYEFMEHQHWASCLTEYPDLRPKPRASFLPEFRTQVRARYLRDGYPTLQCRLETYIAAALGEERASCWYPGSKKTKR